MKWLGFFGTALVIIAYLPQIIHLIKKRCSAGVSVRAYLIWGFSAILLLTYAVSLRDIVFIALQTYQLATTSLIAFYAYKYRNFACEVHGGHSSSRLKGIE